MSPDPLAALARQLRSVNVAQVCGPVLSKAGANMRDRARQEAPGGPHLRHYARSIVFTKDGPLAVEVGAAEERPGNRQGQLSAVLEYGQGTNAPHPHIVPQLEREAGPTVDWLAKVLGDAL